MGDIHDALTKAKQRRYVAFVDLLGFGAAIKTDWSDAAKTYGRIVGVAQELRNTPHTQLLKKKGAAPEIQFWSDSVVIIGPELLFVAEAVQYIQSAALLAGNMLTRGCIAVGHHANITEAANTFVVSEALVRAVDGEKRAHYPRVMVDEEDGVGEEIARHEQVGNTLFFRDDDGVIIVPPFVENLGNDQDIYRPYERTLDVLISRYQNTRHLPKYAWMKSLIHRLMKWRNELEEEFAEERGAHDDDHH